MPATLDVDPATATTEELTRAAGQMEPADAAEVLGDLEPERAVEVIRNLDHQQAADCLAELEQRDAAEVLTLMRPERAAEVLHEMDPDDRVDVLEDVPEAEHDAIVAAMSAEDRQDVETLERYPPDTAGGIMTTRVTKLLEDMTVGEAIEQLRQEADEVEQMFYSYVVDARGHLVGVVSMRNLILSRPARPLAEVIIEDVQSVPADLDQEEVAGQFRKYNFLAMPVVDEKHRLIGIVTVDDIVDVVQEEATEDVQVLFGAGAEERLSSPWTFSFRQRVGWLVVNLVTAFAAGAVVALFDGVIAKLAVLAAFMPIVAGMGGNASAQAMAVAVRGLAGDAVDSKLVRHVLRREFMVGLLTGIVIGVATGVIALLYGLRGGDPSAAAMLGLVVFLALLINHTLACVSGAGIPIVLKRFGLDPAQSATIFATTVTDIVGFFSLLGLAYLAIDYLT